MEDRLIEIIKTGKGEIKDLVAAERELGIWRTKIEEMEGEIRYYTNQVSLSTLTINLVEKEIQAASALVVNRSHKTAHRGRGRRQGPRGGPAEGGGRATGPRHQIRMKQHAAGQFEAILQIEIAPEKADDPSESFI